MGLRRRDFLRLSALSGLGVVTMPGAARADAPYPGPFFVSVHASGGWDPTSLCDPKGRANEEEESPVNHYFTDDIGTAGPIRYAPVEGVGAFFDKHHARLLVINGLDTSTNGHDSGTRNVWSGNLTEGHPSFTALVAAAAAPERPMSFVSNGGYDHTAGLVARTRVGNTDAIGKLAFPDRIEPDDPEATFHAASTHERLAALRKARMDRRVARRDLPKVARAVSLLFAARQGSNELRRLSDHLPAELADDSMQRQAQLAVAAFKSGLAVSANLVRGGFDTHGNHDQNHYPRLRELLEGVDFLLDEAERQGIADQLVVCVGSDFGRTPWYNDGNGKDHWSISSMLLMGPGIRGGRVVGATDERHRPLTVNPTSLAIDPAGVRITPSHVHQALRGLAGVEAHHLARQFPLSGDPLPLFA